MLRSAPTANWYASLGRVDEDAIVAHWLRLSPDCLHRRFLQVVQPRDLRARARAALSADAHAIGWFHGGELDGVAELFPTGNGHAEAAFTVDGRFRRMGVGKGLMSRILRRARNIGIRRVTVMTRRDNSAMIRLAAAAGAGFEADGPEITGLIALGPATPASVLVDVGHETTGAARALADTARRMAEAWSGAWPTPLPGTGARA